MSAHVGSDLVRVPSAARFAGLRWPFSSGGHIEVTSLGYQSRDHRRRGRTRRAPAQGLRRAPHGALRARPGRPPRAPRRPARLGREDVRPDATGRRRPRRRGDPAPARGRGLSCRAARRRGRGDDARRPAGAGHPLRDGSHAHGRARLGDPRRAAGGPALGARRPRAPGRRLAPPRRRHPHDEIAAATDLLERVCEDAPVACSWRRSGRCSTSSSGSTTAPICRRRWCTPTSSPSTRSRTSMPIPNSRAVASSWSTGPAPARPAPLVARIPVVGRRCPSPKLVDLIVSRYRRRVTPEPEELDRLASVMSARPLLLDCWRVAHHGHPASQVVAELPELRRTCEGIAALARQAFADGSR